MSTPRLQLWSFILAATAALPLVAACGSFGEASPLTEAGTPDGAGADGRSPSACDTFDRVTPVGAFWAMMIGEPAKLSAGTLATFLQSSSPQPSLLRTGVRPCTGCDVEVTARVKVDAAFSPSFSGGTIHIIEIDASRQRDAEQEYAAIGVREHELYVSYRTYPSGVLEDQAVPNVDLDALAKSAVKLTLRVKFAPAGSVVVLVDDKPAVNVDRKLSRAEPPTEYVLTIGPDPAGPTPLNKCTFDDVCLSP